VDVRRHSIRGRSAASPTATTSKMRFAADTVYHIEVQPGDKIAFITNT
jgi:hypothetical protein